MRTVSAIVVAIAAVLFVAPDLAAAQDPDLFRVGDAEVWAIRDGGGEMDVGSIFPGDPDVIKRFVPGGKIESNIFTFLFKIDGQLILADTGLGKAGQLPEGLKSLGVTPEQIDTVVITHMHGDHIGGLLKNGERAFPNATVKLGQMEHDYWTSRENREKNPARQASFDMAKSVVDAYAGRLELFEFGQVMAPGLTAREAIGHTPGHTALYLESKGEELLCVADLIHAAVLQFPRPDMSPRYDIDPETAQQTRLRYLRLAAKENIPIAGMHLPKPGVGRVVTTDGDSFEFVPGL